jgi:hypothetical protein
MDSLEDIPVDEIKDGHFILGDTQVHSGAFAVTCVYILFTGGLAVYAFLANRAHAETTGDEQGAYFLAGRSFGPVVLFLTLFSTQFSGFTVVFVPLEVAWSGMSKAGRVISFMGAMVLSMYLIPNFRILGTARKHTTLAEFYLDRYRSTTLTCTLILVLCGAAMPYIRAQFIALSQMVNTITDSTLLGSWAVVGFAGFIYFCELIGGMRGVALTDALQSGVMICCYIVAPLIVWYYWGGIRDYTHPECSNSLEYNQYTADYKQRSLFCQMKGCNERGCLDSCPLDYYQCANDYLNLTTKPDEICGVGNYDINFTYPCNDTNPGRVDVMCQGCYGSAGAILGDPNIFIRYPAAMHKVRKTPCWPRSWANFSLL